MLEKMHDWNHAEAGMSPASPDCSPTEEPWKLAELVLNRQSLKPALAPASQRTAAESSASKPTKWHAAGMGLRHGGSAAGCLV